MAEVGPAEPAASQALATLLNRVGGRVRGRRCAALPIPVLVKHVAFRPFRVGSTQSKRSIPVATALENILGTANAHQIPGPINGQEVRGHLQRRRDLFPALADAHSADGVAIEVQSRSGPQHTRAAQVGVRASLNDAEERLVGSLMWPPCSGRPGDGPIDGLAISSRLAGSAGQWSRHIATSAPSALLNGDGPLGSQLEQAAVEVRPERQPLVINPAPIGQAENLETAGIRQDRPVPAHERVQSAQRRNDVLTRPKRQVVGIRQKHSRSGIANLVGRQPLDCRLRSDRHERRGLDRPVRRLQPTQPRP